MTRYKYFIEDWWLTIDRWLLFCVFGLMIFGYIMSFAASPVIAHKLEIPLYHFTYKHMFFSVLGIFVMLFLSCLRPDKLRVLVFIMMVFLLFVLASTLFIGVEIKGASRWLRIAGISLQPSEFYKPCFVVVIAWCLAMKNIQVGSSQILAFGLWLLTCCILVLQPDIGQMILLSCVCAVLFFLAGGSYRLMSVLSLIGLCLSVFVYHQFSHVHSRVNSFLDSSQTSYQTDKALSAIKNGGVFGTGLGNGQVKHILPDAHTDYVFAVAVEEGGVIFGSFIILIFMAIIFRVFCRLKNIKEHWVQLASAGLVTLFGLQAVINLSVNLNLIPAKGMTLPFVSYGGSSVIALAITMGLLLSFTRFHKKNRSILPQRYSDGSILQEISDG